MRNTISKILKNKFSWITVIVVLVVSIIIALFSGKEAPPTVINTDPKNGEEGVLETKQISINMNTDISDSAKEDISISFSPNVNFDSSWLNNIYTIKPNENLLNNTDYTVQIYYKNEEIYRFTFETNIFSQEDIKEYGASQTEDDYVYGQALKEVINEYPFYTKLPIKTENYVVYYDFEQKMFAITIISPPENDEQRDQFINDALSNIREISEDTPVQYYVNDYTDTSSTP